MAQYEVFNNIQIGKKFRTSALITYQKVSTKESKPILNSKNVAIANGQASSTFYNSRILLEVLN